MENKGVEHEYVAMKFISTFLTYDSHRWFKCLPDNHLPTYEYFVKLFKNRWETKKYSRMLMN